MGIFAEEIVTTDTLGRRTGPRTRHTVEEKLRIVEETRARGASVATVALSSANIGFINRSGFGRHWPALWHYHPMLMVSGIISQLVVETFRWWRLAFRSPQSIRAENLFLRRQLALYVERGVKPRRVDPITRITLALLSRFFSTLAGRPGEWCAPRQSLAPGRLENCSGA